MCMSYNGSALCKQWEIWEMYSDCYYFEVNFTKHSSWVFRFMWHTGNAKTAFSSSFQEVEVSQQRKVCDNLEKQVSEEKGKFSQLVSSLINVKCFAFCTLCILCLHSVHIMYIYWHVPLEYVLMALISITMVTQRILFPLKSVDRKVHYFQSIVITCKTHFVKRFQIVSAFNTKPI